MKYIYRSFLTFILFQTLHEVDVVELDAIIGKCSTEYVELVVTQRNLVVI